jgi:hypothetical protein
MFYIVRKSRDAGLSELRAWAYYDLNGKCIRTNPPWILSLESLGAHFCERQRHPTQIIRKVSIDLRARDGKTPHPVRHHQGDRLEKERKGRASEFQKTRHPCIREEDFVPLFHLLLEPVQNVLEVEQYQPVGRARARIAADGRDVKVVSLIEEYPEKGSVFFCFLSSMTPGYLIYLTYASKPNS